MNRRLITAALVACTLSSLPAIAQTTPRLYVLARLNRIVELVGYDTPTPTAVEVVRWDNPIGAFGFPMAFEVERGTGDFLVLASQAWFSFMGTDSFLLRIDRLTGATTIVATMQRGLVDGLEQRSDGQLFSIGDDGQSLLRIDGATGAIVTTPLSTQIGDPASGFWGGLTMDERGMLIAEYAEGIRYVIDPSNGAVVSQSPQQNLNIWAAEADGQGLLYQGPVFGDMFVEDLATGQRTILPGTFLNFSNVYGIAFDEPVDGEGIHGVCGGLPNSTGASATLEVIGTAVAADNDLTFYCRQLPAQSFGYFLTGPNLGFSPVSSGLLCIGAPQARYSLFPLNSGLDGTVRFAIDLNNLPSGGAPVAGRTDVFQYWYRDQGGTSNFSAAQAVTLR